MSILKSPSLVQPAVYACVILFLVTFVSSVNSFHTPCSVSTHSPRIPFQTRTSDTHRRVASFQKFPLSMSNENDGETENNNSAADNDTYDPRDNFGRSIRGFQSSALKETIEVGDTIVCKRSVPSLGIYENTSYELKSIYAQSFDEATQSVVKQPLESLADSVPLGCDVYITLFSPVHHSEAVVVTPDEVGLSSVRSELGDAAWLALPGLFWVFVALSFYNTYYERTGGSFLDAFWGR